LTLVFLPTLYVTWFERRSASRAPSSTAADRPVSIRETPG